MKSNETRKGNLEMEPALLPALSRDSVTGLCIIMHLPFRQKGKASAFAHKSVSLAERVPASNKL